MNRKLGHGSLALPLALLAASCGGGDSPTAIVGPTATSVAAAKATVQNNALCDAPNITTAFYWEIGDAGGPLLTGLHTDPSGAALDPQGNPITASGSHWSIASASKWIYATYVVEKRGATDFLNQTDISIPYLNFTSGFTNLGNYPPTTACSILDTVDQCIAGLPTTPDPATVGAFFYDSGHMEEHAAAVMGLGSYGVNKLKTEIESVLGTDVHIAYTQPLLATAVLTTASDYGLFLRRILSATYQMNATLSANAVCTNSTVSGCNAVPGKSPITSASNGIEAWHYSTGHWIEDDPAVGDGAFSSPGALGFYPWIDKTRTYYGIIAREDTTGALNGNEEGYKSALCGRLIRMAWVTGTEQTGTVPTP